MSKKKKIIIGAVAAVLALGGVSCWVKGQQAAAMAMMPTYQTTQLAPMDLTNTISTSGTVESQNSYKVYSYSTGKVQTVNVEVGDRVEAGDVLCQLDTSDLQLSKESTQAAINQSYASAQHQLDVSQRQYENAQADLKDKMNAQVESAKASYELAKDAYYNAKSAYNKADGQDEDAIDDAYDAYKAAVNQRNELKTAHQGAFNTQSEAQKKLDDLRAEWKTLNDKADKTPEEMEKMNRLNNVEIPAAETDLAEKESVVMDLEGKLALAEAKMNAAEISYEATFGDQSALEKLEQAYDQAKISYENAKKQLNIAENSADQQLESYADNVKGSKIALNSTAAQQAELKRIDKQINDATITTPISGTVTAVYAEEGASGSGLLFVVEDIDHLKVSTTIKEYDISDVEVGMQTIIKADATGDDEYNGTLSSIDPVAVKGADGNTAKGSSVEFASEISVDDTNTRLKVGMNARISIVTSQKTGVYGVPYDAVVTKPDGTTVVYIAVAGERGTVAQEVPVTMGMETDFYVEISSDALEDGMNVISNPAGLTDGAEVTLSAGLV